MNATAPHTTSRPHRPRPALQLLLIGLILVVGGLGGMAFTNDRTQVQEPLRTKLVHAAQHNSAGRHTNVQAVYAGSDNKRFVVCLRRYNGAKRTVLLTRRHNRLRVVRGRPQGAWAEIMTTWCP